MEKITTKIDGNSSKEFVKGTYILDYVALGVGLLCLILYVIFGIQDGGWFIGFQLVLLIIGLLLIVMAAVLLSMLNTAIKKANDFVRTITYTFEEDYFSYEISRNDEMIEKGRLPYSDLTEYKETKNYVYIGLKNNTWFAISKVDGLVDFLSSKGLHKFKAIKAIKK